MDVELYNKSRKCHSEVHKFDISNNQNEEELLLTLMNDFHFLPYISESVIPSFERLTINKSLPNNNNTTINEVKLLKNPPEKSIKKYGRANLIGKSVLYAAFIFPTVLSENTPEIGDLVTVSDWKLKENDNPLIVYPIFDYYNSKELQLLSEFNRITKDLPENLKDILIVDACMIASAFSKFVEKGKEINYTLSAHLSDKIFNELQNGKIEAIIYPSVKDGVESSNIALKPEVFNQKYKLAQVRECLVISKNKDGIYLQELKRSYNFDEFICWSKGELLDYKIEF
jgi:hypothetical protein